MVSSSGVRMKNKKIQLWMHVQIPSSSEYKVQLLLLFATVFTNISTMWGNETNRSWSEYKDKYRQKENSSLIIRNNFNLVTTI